jgi:transcriptional regulator with XRE-family HTH domain
MDDKRLDDFASAPDTDEHRRIGARLREAREYVGLSQDKVADFLGIPRASVSALESGKRRVSGLELRRLAPLYRRSVKWLLGEEESPAELQGALYRTTAGLSATDREQVLRFAQFLASAGAPHRPSESRRSDVRKSAVRGEPELREDR